MYRYIRNLFRKRCLRKFGSRNETGFLPLRDIRKAVVVLGSSEEDWEKTLGSVRSFFKRHDVKVSVIYTDLRKPGKKAPLRSPEGETVTRRSTNWFGKPDMKRFGDMIRQDTDLFISLACDFEFPVFFMAAASPAKFKIGCRETGPIPSDFKFIAERAGDPLDMVMTPPAGPEDKLETQPVRPALDSGECFSQITDFLEKII